MRRSASGKAVVVGGLMFLAMATAAQAGQRDADGPGGFGALEAMPTETLEQARGRDGVNVHLEQINVQSIQDMEAITSGARFQVVNGDMATGDITFESGAMGRYSGTGIFNSVTGNANAINNAIGISVYIVNP